MKITLLIILFCLSLGAQTSQPLTQNTLFTLEELEYIKNHKNIHLCLHSNVYPIDGMSEGSHSGIMGDIYKEISQKTEINFLPVMSKSYEDLAQKIDSKECLAVSILPTHSKKFPNLIKSKPFFNTYFTIISTTNKSFVKEPHGLRGKKLLVQFQAHKEKILNSYPYLKIEVQNDAKELMRQLLSKEVYSVVAANEVADYLIDKHGHGKLKINGFLAKENVIYGSLASHEDEPLLASILQKALDDIAVQKIQNIIKSWRLTRYHDNTNYKLMIIIVCSAIVLFLIMLYYQRKLKSSNDKLALSIEELVKKEQLLTLYSKQAAMGEMINMIAHQWRQPLSTISLQISNMQLAKLMGQSLREEEIDTMLSDISDRVLYLSETVNDFQTYFRPNKEKVSVSVGELLHKVTTLNNARIEQSSINISINIQSEMILNIYANELIQVLLNILNNAIDALENSTKDDKAINLNVKSDAEYVYFCIEDNAGGIEEKYIDRLFEHDFSTKGEKGSGLGLYMSKMIIQKRFHGDIDVSTSSAGTTFIVKILL